MKLVFYPPPSPLLTAELFEGEVGVDSVPPVFPVSLGGRDLQLHPAQGQEDHHPSDHRRPMLEAEGGQQQAVWWWWWVGARGQSTW